MKNAEQTSEKEVENRQQDPAEDLLLPRWSSSHILYIIQSLGRGEYYLYCEQWLKKSVKAHAWKKCRALKHGFTC